MEYSRFSLRPLQICLATLPSTSNRKYRQIRILIVLSVPPRQKKRMSKANRETGMTNTTIFVTISFTFSSSSLTSIKKRKAAAWICRVTVGSSSDSRIVIRS